MAKELPRGLRNNNPLNLIISDTPWLGKVDREHNTDGTFEQFMTLELGYRAAIVNIRTMIRRDRLDTINTLIPRWAPEPNPAQVEHYIDYVSRRSYIGRSDRLLYANKNQICRLVHAMALFENGIRPKDTEPYLSFGRIENAWALI